MLLIAGCVLQTLRSGIVAEQIFENRQDVLAVLDDAFENRPKLRLAFGFAIPFGEHGGGDADVAAEFVGGMAAQKEAVENAASRCGNWKSCRVSSSGLGMVAMGEIAVYRFQCGRQEVGYLSRNIDGRRPKLDAPPGA